MVVPPFELLRKWFHERTTQWRQTASSTTLFSFCYVYIYRPHIQNNVTVFLVRLFLTMRRNYETCVYVYAISIFRNHWQWNGFCCHEQVSSSSILNALGTMSTMLFYLCHETDFDSFRQVKPSENTSYMKSILIYNTYFEMDSFFPHRYIYHGNIRLSDNLKRYIERYKMNLVYSKNFNII